MCSSIILKSVQPDCLDKKKQPTLNFSGGIYIPQLQLRSDQN